MKVYSVKSVYLSLDELKEAIANWLQENGEDDLAKHMKANLCEFDWSTQEGGSAHLAVDMDGTFDEKMDGQFEEKEE